MSDSNTTSASSSVEEETRQYYINALMHDVETIKRKSFRRLILLRYVVEFESYEVKGETWNSWVSQKDEHVTENVTNFVRALNVSLVREMRPTAESLCSEDDVEFLYGVSDDTLREYVKVTKAFLT